MFAWYGGQELKTSIAYSKTGIDVTMGKKASPNFDKDKLRKAGLEHLPIFPPTEKMEKAKDKFCEVVKWPTEP